MEKNVILKKSLLVSFTSFFMPLILLTSCLNENPKDRLTGDEAFNTANNIYINSVTTLYNYIGGHAESQGLQGTYRGVYDYNTFTTDEAMLPTRGGDWYDGGFWQNLYLHKWTASDVTIYNTWNYLYKEIMLCNTSLRYINENSSELTSAQNQSFTAEVRAIRAMFYYYLMDMFGNIPVITSDKTSLNDVTQSSRSSVMKFIVSELQEVAPLLPEEHSNYEGNYYGRITRPVIYFILAKIALNAEIYNDDNWTDNKYFDGKNITFTVDGSTMNAWQTVITYCDKIKAEGYSLENDYSKNFSVHNENTKENIFIIPMDKTLYQNEFQYLFRSRHYNHGSAIGMDAENGSCATVSTVKAYGYATDSIDKRYSINFYSDTLKVDGNIVYLDDGTPLVYKPLEVKLDLTNSPFEKTAGARMSKYEIDRTAYSDGKLQDNDIVLFRYSDVLLMKAEAKMRMGTDGSTELNAIRNRVGMKNRTCTLKNILNERLMELMWEGWRRNDLVRFRLFNKAYDQRPQLENESSGYTTVFPIPERTLELNKNLKQNPGYE
jgi:hypothetical protein